MYTVKSNTNLLPLTDLDPQLTVVFRDTLGLVELPQVRYSSVVPLSHLIPCHPCDGYAPLRLRLSSLSLVSSYGYTAPSPIQAVLGNTYDIRRRAGSGKGAPGDI